MNKTITFRRDRFPEFFYSAGRGVAVEPMLVEAARYINADYILEISEIEPGVFGAAFTFATPEEQNRFWIFAHDMLMAKMRRWAEAHPL
jgi:hypothetical protein